MFIIYLLFYTGRHFLKDLFILEREIACALARGGAEGEGGRESQADLEPDVGLDLTVLSEIMT